MEEVEQKDILFQRVRFRTKEWRWDCALPSDNISLNDQEQKKPDASRSRLREKEGSQFWEKRNLHTVAFYQIEHFLLPFSVSHVYLA